jgi:hypothetical protein
LYHVVAYLVSLDKLFDDQAKHLREQISHSKDAPSPSGSSRSKDRSRHKQ